MASQAPRTLEWSKSNRELRCFDCHQAHSNQDTANLFAAGNAAGLFCHTKENRAGLRGTVSEHTHHAETSPGSQCVATCNPIRWVRQSAKRRKILAVLDVAEIRLLLDSLQIRERTLVLLDAGTGLRMSELFGLKWKDVNFQANEIRVTRSIVMQVVGPCKTEASQKPVPLDPNLAEALLAWRRHTRYNEPDDWIFASPEANGRRPHLGSAPHAQANSTRRSSRWDNQANRMAHLPPHLFNIAASKQD